MRLPRSPKPELLVLICCFVGMVFLGVPISSVYGQTKTADPTLVKKTDLDSRSDNKEYQGSGKETDKALAEKSLHIVSDKMVALQDSSMVEFMGNVKATREDSVILADSIKVFFQTSDTGKDDQSRVKKIISIGNVEYTSGERKAFADQMVYTTEDEVLVLTGKSPKLLTGKSWVTGKKITLFRKQDRAVVESDPESRVEAFFDPQDKTE